MHRLVVAACLACALMPRAAAETNLFAGLIRTPTMVGIILPDGRAARLEGLVTRPDRPGRFPLVVLVHGTPRGTGAEFRDEIARLSPTLLSGPALAFATRGYATVSILRRGFGRSDGPYVEAPSGPCGNRDYLANTRSSSADVIGAAAALRREPWVDPDRIVLLGFSTGGLAVTAAAATNPAGVVAVLDFAGGHGSYAPGHVCSEGHLEDAFRLFGSTAKVPALWLYAENDMFFSPDLAQRMFEAYTAAGAPAKLVMLPPFGEDGHLVLTQGPEAAWWPSVEVFLTGLGLPTKVVVTLPPMPALPPPPGVHPACTAGFARYVALRTEAKAFAIGAEGQCGWSMGGRDPDAAKDEALRQCAMRGRGCALYAVAHGLADK